MQRILGPFPDWSKKRSRRRGHHLTAQVVTMPGGGKDYCIVDKKPTNSYHVVNAGIEEGAPRYSGTTGLIYIFNLIVGTGALTLPAAFHDAGWALGSAVIVMLAFMSYLTTTFVIESMAAANAMQNFKRYITHCQLS